MVRDGEACPASLAEDLLSAYQPPGQPRVNEMLHADRALVGVGHGRSSWPVCHCVAGESGL